MHELCVEIFFICLVKMTSEIESVINIKIHMFLIWLKIHHLTSTSISRHLKVWLDSRIAISRNIWLAHWRKFVAWGAGPPSTVQTINKDGQNTFHMHYSHIDALHMIVLGTLLSRWYMLGGPVPHATNFRHCASQIFLEIAMRERWIQPNFLVTGNRWNCQMMYFQTN